jgi:fatty acid desaturase
MMGILRGAMINKLEKKWFRSEGGLIPNMAALAYCHLAFLGGGALIFSLEPAWMALGTLVLAHGMVIAAYMIHDCAHNAVFRLPRHNAAFGRALSWLTGGCYATYEDIRATHMRHHVENSDATGFDYRVPLIRYPLLRRVVEAAEWFYVPAVELLMHAMLILAPFLFEERRAQRRRVTAITVVRFGLLAAVFLYSPWACLCYLLAYLLFMTVLRFMDALQHNYGDDMEGDAGHKGDRAYEQSHTFSNPVSLRYPWLNLLTLNFGYHNAHHARPTAPWHTLPSLHSALHGGDAPAVIPFRKQLASFHRNRIARIWGDASETQGVRFLGRLHEGRAVGVNGVSFLTPF